MLTRWYLTAEVLPHPLKIVLIGFIDGTVSLGTYKCDNSNIRWYSCGQEPKSEQEYLQWDRELKKLEIEPKYWIHLSPQQNNCVLD